MRNLILTLMIWVIAFTAMTVGIVLAYHWYRNHGTEIQISFDDASGLVPGQSKIIYRGVQVGNITNIVLSSENGNPIVKARVKKTMANMLGKNSKFWIIRPELGFGGVKNLSAISTGSYVAVEPAKPIKNELGTNFVGSTEELIDPIHFNGLKIYLKGSSAEGLNSGTPILYKGLQIGEVGALTLSKDRRSIVITVYIEKRYSDVVRKCSYFGNVSGFHTELHFFGGSPIDVDSMRSLMQGGISLFTPCPSAARAANGDTFKMYTAQEMREDN